MSLYVNIVNVCKPYLGIAAEQFIQRQCKAHLNCAPDQITSDKLPELAKWAVISGGLVIGKDKAEELSQKVLKI